MLEMEELAISKRLLPKVPIAILHTSSHVRRKTSLPDSLPLSENRKIGKLDGPSVLHLGRKKLVFWAACQENDTTVFAVLAASRQVSFECKAPCTACLWQFGARPCGRSKALPKKQQTLLAPELSNKSLTFSLLYIE